MKISSFREYRDRLRSALELVLLVFISLALFLNQWHMVALQDVMPAMAQASGSPVQSSDLSVLPHGIPARYGAALGVSFDNAVQAMPILQNFDGGPGAITLTGALQQRYIAIGSRTACEFCCGATTLVFPDGKPACGCAHSAAMRGVARYLLQQYPDMSDADILAEVNRWKAVFFPGPMSARASQSSGAPSSALPAQVGGC